MSTFRRFGRRFPVPSTVPILYELRALSESEDARMRCASEDGLPSKASWEDIVLHRTRLETSSGPSKEQMSDPAQSQTVA